MFWESGRSQVQAVMPTCKHEGAPCQFMPRTYVARSTGGTAPMSSHSAASIPVAKDLSLPSQGVTKRDEMPAQAKCFGGCGANSYKGQQGGALGIAFPSWQWLVTIRDFNL